jgi:transcription initiation factor TFIIH subunit 4
MEPWKDFTSLDEDKPIKQSLKIEEIEEASSSMWSKVLEVLLNVKSMYSVSSFSRSVDTVKSIKAFCKSSQLMRDGKITSVGYEYLLKERQSQVWIFVKDCISRLKSSEQALSLLFMLSYCEVGKSYPTDALTAAQKILVQELATVGIILLRDDTEYKRAFFPTKVSINLIFQRDMLFNNDGLTLEISDITGNSYSFSTGRASVANDESFDGSASRASIAPTFDSSAVVSKGALSTSKDLEIIVQTNCQVIAYSFSDLHIAMLQLFVDITMRFPNMVTGRISRDRIKDAYRMGMTADQIISFLSSHAHPKLAGRNPIVPDNVCDQLLLWQAENSRLRFQECVVLELGKVGVSREVFNDLVDYAQKRLQACLWLNAEKFTIALTIEGYTSFKDYAQDEYNIY